MCVAEIDINKALGYSCKVNNVFMDPIGGHHVLLSVSIIQNANSSPAGSSSNCSLLYLNTSSPVLKLKQVGYFWYSIVSWGEKVEK